MTNASRFWIIDWDDNSVLFTDDYNDVNMGSSCRYRNNQEMIEDVRTELAYIEEWGRERS